MPDKEAIHRLKQGDIGGLETLITRHQVKAVRAAYFIVQDQQSAEDVVQETFLKIYRGIKNFDENRPFEPYLMRSVVNAAYNAVRHDAHETSLDGLDNDHHFEELLSRAAPLENQLEFREWRRSILEALAQLPPRQRAAIVQRYYLEMGEEEMASTIGVAPGTVKWLLHAARNRLRDLLKPQRKIE